MLTVELHQGKIIRFSHLPSPLFWNYIVVMAFTIWVSYSLAHWIQTVICTSVNG